MDSIDSQQDFESCLMQLKVMYNLGDPRDTYLATRPSVNVKVVSINDNSGLREYGQVTLKQCISAICIASPELVAERKIDYAVYTMDPIESHYHGLSGSNNVFIGNGMLSWCLSEPDEGSSKIIGKITVKRDHFRISTDSNVKVLEVHLKLCETKQYSAYEYLSTLQFYIEVASRLPPNFKPSDWVALTPHLNQLKNALTDKNGKLTHEAEKLLSATRQLNITKKVSDTSNNSVRSTNDTPTTPKTPSSFSYSNAITQETSPYTPTTKQSTRHNTFKSSRSMPPAFDSGTPRSSCSGSSRLSQPSPQILRSIENIPTRASPRLNKVKGFSEAQIFSDDTDQDILKQNRIPKSGIGEHNNVDNSDLCYNCGAMESRYWRSPKIENRRLCNACGLYYNKNALHRPRELWGSESVKRRSKKDADKENKTNDEILVEPLVQTTEKDNKASCAKRSRSRKTEEEISETNIQLKRKRSSKPTTGKRKMRNQSENKDELEVSNLKFVSASSPGQPKYNLQKPATTTEAFSDAAALEDFMLSSPGNLSMGMDVFTSPTSFFLNRQFMKTFDGNLEMDEEDSETLELDQRSSLSSPSRHINIASPTGKINKTSPNKVSVSEMTYRNIPLTMDSMTSDLPSSPPVRFLSPQSEPGVLDSTNSAIIAPNSNTENVENTLGEMDKVIEILRKIQSTPIPENWQNIEARNLLTAIQEIMPATLSRESIEDGRITNSNFLSDLLSKPSVLSSSSSCESEMDIKMPSTPSQSTNAGRYPISNFGLTPKPCEELLRMMISPGLVRALEASPQRPGSPTPTVRVTTTEDGHFQLTGIDLSMFNLS